MHTQAKVRRLVSLLFESGIPILWAVIHAAPSWENMVIHMYYTFTECVTLNVIKTLAYQTHTHAYTPFDRVQVTHERMLCLVFAQLARCDVRQGTRELG